MSYAIKKGETRYVYIEGTPDAKCEMCGKVDELRPYGLMGENICFECGMKDKEMTQKRMNQILFGEGLDS